MTTTPDPWGSDPEVAKIDAQDAVAGETEHERRLRWARLATEHTARQNAARAAEAPLATWSPGDSPVLPPLPASAYPAGSVPLAPPVIVNVTQQHAREKVVPNRVLHAVLTLLTGGAWLLVWIPLELHASKANRRG